MNSQVQPMSWTGREARSAWIMLAIIFSANILSYIDRTIMSLFGPAIKSSLQLSDNELGLLFGLGFIGPLAIATLVAGWAVDRYNRAWLLALGVIVWSAATAACGVASSFPMLLAARGGIGAGESIVAPAGYALIADRFPMHRRGRAVGIMSCAMSVGPGIAYIGGGFLISSFGPEKQVLPFIGAVEPWQFTFILLGALGVPIALLLLLVRDKRTLGEPADRSSSLGELGTLRDSFRSNRAGFSAIFVCQVMTAIIGTAVAAWIPTLFMRQFALAPSTTGMLLGPVFLLSGFLGPLLVAELSDHWARKRLQGGRLHGIPALLCLLMTMVVMIALTSNYIVALIGVLLFISIGGGITVCCYAAIQDAAPAQFRGRLLAALQFSSLGLGYAIGPSLVAFLTDSLFGGPDALPYSLMVVSIPLAAIGIVFGLAARRTAPSKTAAPAPLSC
jgi:MFS family permease